MNYIAELDCINGLPSVSVFWNFLLAEKIRILLIFFIPILLSLLTLWIYSINLKNVMKNCPINIRINCISLVSIYPFVSIFSMIAISVPRTYFFNDSVGHIAFMVISWQFYRLCMIYVDGESSFIEIANDTSFTLKAPPFCCCLPLKRSSISKKNFIFMKFLIIQMPFTHIAMFLVLNIIYIEDIQAFDNLILYFIPFIAITVFSGMWGYNLVVRTLSPYYSSLKLIQKYFAFQLVLFYCKILPIILNFIMKKIITTCEDPAFTILVKRHTVIQIHVQIQMFILSVWAMNLYKNPMGN
ncbi:hypothetical protein PVAND_010325 [Polypedilum vanderplanki]|uniref:Organic solute transporter alpha-like protein n=1 Tax=Polypedilum vanderplanki TaxID=319348 RepID=A0A9J6CFJ9_POLVA|nr:hypothetical protein PVAND_010325 [Polypedilum vanderplanki]